MRRPSDWVRALEVRWKLGVRGTLARDRYLRSILSAPPVDLLEDGRAEVHLLTSDGDWMNALWGLYSFYRLSGERYRLCVHEDGTLGEPAARAFQRLFPGCRVIRESEAAPEVLSWLKDFPRCQLLRKTRFISKKEFDFNYYLDAPLGILFDSDLIFFDRPAFVCDTLVAAREPGNWVNRDVAPGLSMSSEAIRRTFGLEVPDRYNSGFGTWHRGSIRNEDLERFLADQQVLDHPWRFEQTLHALCSAGVGAHLLPEEYDIYWGPLKDRPVMRHYVGAIRHRLYSEGVFSLRRRLF